MDIDYNMKSAWELDKESVILNLKEKYSDFVCHQFDKKKYNDTEILILVCSYSFYSSNLGKVLYAGQTQGWILNHKTKKVYSIVCTGEPKDVIKDSKTFLGIISTFKLL